MKQQRVYRELREAIYSGQLKPGQKLVERQLALKFATSRVPLRESLLRLVSEGLVRHTPGRTSFVEDLTADDVQEIWLMRRTLEPVAARLVAQGSQRRSVAKRLLLLADRMAKYLRADQDARSAECDLEFHLTIIEATKSPRLVRAYELSHVPMLMSRLTGERGEPDELLQQHVEYARLIEQGTPDAAEQYARWHVIEIADRMPSGGQNS